MGRIIGEQFKKYVVNQIEQRQKAHGSGVNGERTMDQLTYLNSKTAWVKLASGVFVSDERRTEEKLRDEFSGDTLAKRNVLFGGTSDMYKSDKLNQRGAYRDDSLNITNKTWGTYNVNALSDSSEFGLVPMPGITSVDVKCMNRGSIRKATVNLKCYSPEQFKVIDLLYLRLGYTVFLEYGNSLYLKDGKLQEMGYTLTELKNGFFSPKWKEKSYSAFLPVVEGYRASKMGNYDGMLSKVVNFSWTFAQDGSYDITLELISLGDVVESLKINTTPSYDMREFISTAYELYEKEAAAGGDANVSIDKSSSPANNAISSYLFLQKILLDKEVNTDNGKTGAQRFFAREVTIEAGGSPLNLGGSFIPKAKDGVLNSLPSFTLTPTFDTKDELKEFMNKTYPQHTDITILFADSSANVFNVQNQSTSCYCIVSYGLIDWDYFAYIITFPEDLNVSSYTADKKDVVYFNYNEGKDDEDAQINDSGFYMRWGNLIQFMNDNIIPIIKGSDESGKSTPTVDIDYDKWGNRMYTLPYQVSLDPRVCIVKSAHDINSKKYYKQLIDFKDPEKEYAWTMNIYLSHNQILASLNENLDEKGNIALFGFLESLCIAVNKAMGGINNLEPFLDEDTNTLYIVDASYQPKPEPSPYIMQLYGYNSGSQDQAGFVRNFNLKTEITNEFATMASIGSTVGGYVKGTENTMFSKWNRGLRDRWKEEYVVPDKKSRHKEGEVDEPNKMYVKEFWNKRYSAFGLTLTDVAYDTVNDDQGALNDDIIDSNIEIVTEFYKYIQAEIHTEKSGSYSSPSNGFIPINLGITMDGIAGIKIYNEVNVNTSFLPSNYPDSLRFIIKGVNHKLSDGDWETTLETVVISKSNDKSNPPLTQVEIKEIMDRYIKEGISSSGGSTGGSTPNNAPSTPRSNSTGNNQGNPNWPILRDVVPSKYNFLKYKDGAVGTSKPSQDRINPNLLADLQKAAKSSGVIPTITTAITGHRSGSRHNPSGKGIDIAIIGGIGSGGATNASNGDNQFRILGNKFKNALVALGYTWNKESGQDKAVLWQTSRGGNHYNHIHVSNRLE